MHMVGPNLTVMAPFMEFNVLTEIHLGKKMLERA